MAVRRADRKPEVWRVRWGGTSAPGLFRSVRAGALGTSGVTAMDAIVDARCTGQWSGGPAPGQFYRVPCAEGPARRTLSPMVTGTSVLGVKFEGGAVLAADTLGSYGSLARFRHVPRLVRVNGSTALGASGDFADFQHLQQVLGQMV